MLVMLVISVEICFRCVEIVSKSGVTMFATNMVEDEHMNWVYCALSLGIVTVAEKGKINRTVLIKQ